MSFVPVRDVIVGWPASNVKPEFVGEEISICCTGPLARPVESIWSGRTYTVEVVPGTTVALRPGRRGNVPGGSGTTEIITMSRLTPVRPSKSTSLGPGRQAGTRMGGVAGDLPASLVDAGGRRFRSVRLTGSVRLARSGAERFATRCSAGDIHNVDANDCPGVCPCWRGFF